MWGMVIVHIEDFFHPNAGYQINIVPKYLSKFGHKVFIVTAEMEKIPANLTDFFGREDIEKYDREYEELTNVTIIRLPIKKFVSGRAIFTSALMKTINGLNPDVLYVHGNDTMSGITFLSQVKKLNYAVVSDSHMLEMASTNRFNQLFRLFYRTFITPKIIKHKIPVIRTQDDPYVQKCLGIPLEQAPWISYGSDTMLFHPDEKKKCKFKEENSISEDTLVVLYAGKLDEAKGGQFLADAIKKKIECKREICFLIVGNTVGEYGKSIEEGFSESENRVLRYPTQRYVDLAKFYQVADLVIFPKQCSLSFYDAQACGVPVLSENNNINVDRCSHGNGWNFKVGDIKDFRDTLKEIAELDLSKYNNVSDCAYRYIIDNYNYEDKAREYEKIIVDEFKRFKERYDE